MRREYTLIENVANSYYCFFLFFRSTHCMPYLFIFWSKKVARKFHIIHHLLDNRTQMLQFLSARLMSYNLLIRYYSLRTVFLHCSLAHGCSGIPSLGLSGRLHVPMLLHLYTLDLSMGRVFPSSLSDQVVLVAVLFMEYLLGNYETPVETWCPVATFNDNIYVLRCQDLFWKLLIPRTHSWTTLMWVYHNRIAY